MRSDDRQLRLRRYGMAIAFPAAAIVLRFLLAPFLDSQHPHTLTLGAVALAAWYAGPGPAVISGIVGYLAGHVLFDAGTPLASAAGIIELGLYGTSCAAIIGLGAIARSGRKAAEANARDADEQKRHLEHETEQRLAAERGMRERSERIRELADTMPALLWVGDAGSACTFVNQEWLSFTGCDRQALLGSGWLRSIHPDDRGHVRDTLVTAAGRQEAFTAFYRLRYRDGTWRWMIHRGRPTFGRDGELTGYLGSLMDITEEKLAEEALREADRRKDEFLATLAHELRNPLAPIRNAVQILRLKDAPEAMRANARDMIDRQARNLARLVDDLLDVSRITLGRLLLQTKETELSEVIENAVEASRPYVEGSRHTLSVELPTEPVYVDADATRLAQVFINLLNNAAKYTPPGGHISLAAAQEDETVVVRVSDTGIGITPEALPRIFDIFERLDHSVERAQAGLGIGLSLARHLVELHGGHIEAHSEGLGRGSEFTVTLPVCIGSAGAATSREAERTGEAAQERVLRILIVEDNVDTAESISHLLRAAGHETYIAHDGLQAIEVSARLDPDIVILNIGLPGMNGYEVARAIRGRRDREQPRIIALTGWGRDEDKRRATEAGFDQHLTKPVDPVVLRRLVEQVDAARWSGQAS